MSTLALLDETSPVFPETHLALAEPNGLLAIGGNLKVSTLIKAYKNGVFPWFDETQPIMWWTPSPRTVIAPNSIHFSSSLRKFARKRPFRITVDQAFCEVIEHCADIKREGQDGTWITQEIIDAYSELHYQGYAHSIEAWMDHTLVGGLYGINIGKAFFGESMFSLQSGASKMAFSSLAQFLQKQQFELIDCQIHTQYLASFGAKEIDRSEFESLLHSATQKKTEPNWSELWTLNEYGYDGSK